MKNKRNKFLAFVVTLLILFTFIGCSGDATKPTNSPTQSAQPTQTTQPPDDVDDVEYTGDGPVTKEPVTLKILGPNHTHTGRDFLTEEAFISYFRELASAANVELEFELLDSATYTDTISPRLAAGLNLGDIVVAVSDSNEAYIKSGLFVPITEYYNEWGFNFKKAYKAYGASEQWFTASDGNMYFVYPMNMTNSATQKLQINVKWLEKLDMSIPTTIDEFTNVLEKFKENDMNENGDPNDEIPFTFRNLDHVKNMGSFFGLDLESGYRLLDDGTVEASYSSDRYRAYLEWLHDIYTRQLLDNEFFSNTNDILVNSTANEVLGGFYHFSIWSANYVKDLDFYTGDPIYLAIPPLKGTDEEPFYWDRSPVGRAIGITATCEHPEVAFRFLDFAMGDNANWMTEETKALSIAEGISGEGYGSWEIYCLPFRQGGLHDLDVAGRLTSGEQPQWWYDNDITLYPHHKPKMQILYYTSEELDVIEKYSGDLNKYKEEMIGNFISGDIPLTDSEWDKYVKTLIDIGDEEVMNIWKDRYGEQ